MASGSRIPFTGILLILLGAAFLADQFHYLSFREVFLRWWPVLMMVYGLVQLIERPTSPFGPVLLVGLGCAFLLNNFGVIHVGRVFRLWPIVLIAIGASILVGRGRE